MSRQGIQFIATKEDKKMIEQAAETQRRSVASFAYYHTLEAAKNVLGKDADK